LRLKKSVLRGIKVYLDAGLAHLWLLLMDFPCLFLPPEGGWPKGLLAKWKYFSD
jgi:hypothetical protein